MRVVFLLICTVFFAYLALDPQVVYRWQNVIEKQSQALLHTRTVNVFGHKLLAKEKIAQALNNNPNNLMWRFDPNSVTEPLADVALLEQVQLSPCSFFSLTCFKLNVVERQPTLLAKLEQDLWLLSSDGSFLLALPSKLNSQKLEKVSTSMNVPLALGLDSGAVSGAVLRSRSEYVSRSLTQIRKKTGLHVRRVEFKEDGELDIRFRGYPFMVRFSSSFNSPHNLDTEVERFNQVREQIAVYKGAIERIDLAYHKVAVVKLTDQAVAARASLKPKGNVVRPGVQN